VLYPKPAEVVVPAVTPTKATETTVRVLQEPAVREQTAEAAFTPELAGGELAICDSKSQVARFTGSDHTSWMPKAYRALKRRGCTPISAW
jgi:hypothetical protein